MTSPFLTDAEWSDAEEKSAHRAVLFKKIVDAGADACSRGDFPAAIQVYKQAIQLDPTNHVLYSNRSAILCKMGRYEEAHKDANKAYQLKPTWVKALYRKGQALKGMGDYVRALQAYAAGLAQESQNAQLLSGLIECAMASPLRDRLQPIVEELGGLGLDRSPFVLMSVVGQELLSLRHIPQAVDVLECALRVGTTSLKLRQSVLSSLSSAYWALGELEKALNCMKQDLAVAASLGDTAGESRAQANLGMVHLSLGRREEALDHYRHQLALTLKMNDQHSAASVLSTVGELYAQLMDYQNAMASYEQALEILASMRSVYEPDADINLQIGRQYSGMGCVHSAQGNLERASWCYREYLSICRQEGSQSDEAKALAQIGGVQIRCKQWNEASQTLLSAIKSARAVKDRLVEGSVCGQMAELCQSLGQWEQSKKWAEKQLAISLSVKDQAMEGRACGYLGCVFQHSNKFDNAIRLHSKHLQLAQVANHFPGCLIAHKNLGKCAAGQGNWQNALKEHKAELAVARTLRDVSSEGEAHGCLAIVQSHLGNRTQALTNLQCRWQLAKERCDMEAQAAALCCIGEFYLQERDLAKAVEHLEKYLMLAQEQNDVQAERTGCKLLGRAHMESGRTKQAVRYFDQELALAKDCRDHTGMAMAYKSLGEAHFALGQLDEALECQKYFLALAHITTDIASKLKAMSQIGQVLLMKNRVSAATKVLAKGVNLAHASKDTASTADFYGLLGKAYDQAGKPDKALAFYSQELIISNKQGDKHGQYRAYGRIGEHYLKSNKITLCVKAFEDQARIANELSDVDLEAEALGRIGAACTQNHLHLDALTSFEEACRVLNNSKSMNCKRMSLAFKSNQQLAQSQEVLGRLVAALHTHTRLISLYNSDSGLLDSPLKTHCQLLLKRGQLWLRIGNCNKSTQLLDQCLNLLEMANREDQSSVDPMQKCATMKLLATAFCAGGDFHSAEKMIQERLQFVQEVGFVFEENKCMLDVACALRLRGQVDQCMQMLQQQLTLCKGAANSDPFLYCHVLYQLGLTDEVATDLDSAKEHYLAMLAHLHSLGPKLISVQLKLKSLRAVGYIHLSLGEVHRSMQLLQQAVGLAASHSLQEVEAEIRLGMALAHWITNQSQQFLGECHMATLLAERVCMAAIWGNPCETGPTDSLVHVMLFLKLAHLCSQNQFEESLLCAEKLSLWKDIYNCEANGLDVRQKWLKAYSKEGVLREFDRLLEAGETVVKVCAFNSQSVIVWVGTKSTREVHILCTTDQVPQFPCCPYPALQLVLESCCDTIDCNPEAPGRLVAVIARLICSLDADVTTSQSICLQAPASIFPLLLNFEDELKACRPSKSYSIRYINSLVKLIDGAWTNDSISLPAFICYPSAIEADPHICKIYDVAPVFSELLGKAELLERMQKAGIIHLALEVDPESNGLIIRHKERHDDYSHDDVAYNNGQSESPVNPSESACYLTPEEVMQLSLQASIVVLVPMQTNMGQRCHISVQMHALAQAFIIAGSQAVVFSRRALRDPIDCPQFFKKFHTCLRAEKLSILQAYRRVIEEDREDGVEDLVLLGDERVSLVNVTPQQSTVLGHSLRIMLKTPDECREALRVILHLVEKSLQRINSGQDAAMYTSELSVRAKVGPEVKGWLELLQAVGFTREPNCAGDTDISNMQINCSDYSLYFPQSDPSRLLATTSDLLQALLAGLPQTSLLAFGRLVEKNDVIKSVYRKLHNLSDSLDNTEAIQFETYLPTSLYKVDGVHELFASLGLDKMKEDGGQMYVKTIRMQLTRRKVHYALTCMRAIFDDVVSELSMQDESVLNLSSNSIVAGSFLQRELKKLTVNPQVTDFSCLESDFCPTDFASMDPEMPRSHNSGVGFSGYKSDIEPSLQVPHTNSKSVIRKLRGCKVWSRYESRNNGYASESEAKVNASRRFKTFQSTSRAYFSEDESSFNKKSKLSAMKEETQILGEDSLETTAQVLSVDENDSDPGDSGNEDDSVPCEPLNLTVGLHEYSQLEMHHAGPSISVVHPNDPCPHQTVSTFLPPNSAVQPNLVRTISHSPGPPSVCAPSPPNLQNSHADMLRNAAKKLLRHQNTTQTHMSTFVPSVNYNSANHGIRRPQIRPNIGDQNLNSTTQQSQIYKNVASMRNCASMEFNKPTLMPKPLFNNNGFATVDDNLPASMI